MCSALSFDPGSLPEPLLQVSAATVLHSVGHLYGQEFAGVLSALNKHREAGWWDEVYDTLKQQALALERHERLGNVADFPVRLDHLALLHAFSRPGCTSPEVMEALAMRLARAVHAGELGPQGLGSIAKSFAAGGIGSGSVLHAVELQAKATAREFASGDIAPLAVALASLRGRAPEVFKALGERTLECLPDLTPHTFSGHELAQVRECCRRQARYTSFLEFRLFPAPRRSLMALHSLYHIRNSSIISIPNLARAFALSE